MVDHPKLKEYRNLQVSAKIILEHLEFQIAKGCTFFPQRGGGVGTGQKWDKRNSRGWEEETSSCVFER